MTKKKNKEGLAALLFAAAFLVALHQKVTCGHWFEPKDVHHELFIAALGFGGLVALVD
jgi:hypothetical protein